MIRVNVGVSHAANTPTSYYSFASIQLCIYASKLIMSCLKCIDSQVRLLTQLASQKHLFFVDMQHKASLQPIY